MSTISVIKKCFCLTFLVSVCNVKVSPDYSRQIATMQYDDLSTDECLVRGAERNESDFSLVYCPVDGICGLDLKPENTTTLSETSNKTCFVFIRNVTYCSYLDEHLAGRFYICYFH